MTEWNHCACGRFSKSRALSASVSFLSSPPPPPPPSFTRSIFALQFFAPEPHRNACYAGYRGRQKCGKNINDTFESLNWVNRQPSKDQKINRQPSKVNRQPSKETSPPLRPSHSAITSWSRFCPCHFDFICDLLVKRRMAIWNLFVKWMHAGGC